MTSQLGTLSHVKVLDLVPDPEQPRKLFTAERLAELKASITKHGLRTPLIVTKRPDGKYDIVDGERRYRVLSTMHMPLIPVHIITVGTKLERLIEQFNIQETHQGWTASEKASVVFQLSTEAKMTVTEMCKSLNIPDSTVGKYLAYASLMNKSQFDKANISLDHVQNILSTKNLIKTIYHSELKEEFSRTDEKAFENIIINQIVAGDIVNRKDFSKLKNAFKKDPKSIATYLAAKSTPEALFLKTKAQGRQYLSAVVIQGGFLRGNITRYLENPDTKPTAEEIRVVRKAAESCAAFLKKFE